MVQFEEKFLYFQGNSKTSYLGYLENLKKSVYDYANPFGCLYIGITGDIDQRTKAHLIRSRGVTSVPNASQG